MVGEMEPRVLVVDDDAAVGSSINRVLTEKGYRVQEAMSGAEAIEELEHEQYDIVFTDIRMPGMDGLEVVAEVRKLHPGMPVTVITGYGTDANEQKARDLGVSGFLHKPLSPAMILDNAERMVHERREIMEAIRHSALALVSPTMVAAPAVALEAKEDVAKNVALFFAAPFIGLAYILAFPFIGVYAMARYGLKAIGSRG